MNLINKIKKLFTKPANYIIVVNDNEICYRLYHTKDFVFPSLEEVLRRKENLEVMFPLFEYKIYKMLTIIKLTKTVNGKVLEWSTTDLSFVELLKSRGWKVKHNELSELI